MISNSCFFLIFCCIKALKENAIWRISKINIFSDKDITNISIIVIDNSKFQLCNNHDLPQIDKLDSVEINFNLLKRQNLEFMHAANHIRRPEITCKKKTNTMLFCSFKGGKRFPAVTVSEEKSPLCPFCLFVKHIHYCPVHALSYSLSTRRISHLRRSHHAKGVNGRFHLNVHEHAKCKCTQQNFNILCLVYI